MPDYIHTLFRDFKKALTSWASWEFLRSEWSGALAAFLVALPYSIGYGIIAFSPFGAESITAGI